VAAGSGFPRHPHRDHEIFSYVISGGLAHTDSTGTSEVVPAGGVQLTCAGSGITHSEYNADKSRGGPPVHFLQIWVRPHTTGLRPSYQTRVWPAAAKANTLAPFIVPKPPGAAADGTPDALTINADFAASAAILDPGAVVSRALAGRRAYVHVPAAAGAAGVALAGAGGGAAAPVDLGPGDGAFVSGLDTLTVTGRGGAGAKTEVVVMDFP
jgi:quercetin 2,3-dioxygenase